MYVLIDDLKQQIGITNQSLYDAISANGIVPDSTNLNDLVEAMMSGTGLPSLEIIVEITYDILKQYTSSNVWRRESVQFTIVYNSKTKETSIRCDDTTKLTIPVSYGGDNPSSWGATISSYKILSVKEV